jgi:hypothetical protein
MAILGLKQITDHSQLPETSEPAKELSIFLSPLKEHPKMPIIDLQK